MPQVGYYKKAGVGTGASLACIMGVESTTTRRSCACGSGGTDTTGGTHGSARVGERTGSQRLRRGPAGRERRVHARRKPASTGRPHWAVGGREGVSARTRPSLTGGSHLLGRAGARAWPGWVGPGCLG
jgi:hypothetical protein